MPFGNLRDVAEWRDGGQHVEGGGDTDLYLGGLAVGTVCQTFDINDRWRTSASAYSGIFDEITYGNRENADIDREAAKERLLAAIADPK
jgi:hypothetical protein